MEFEKLFSNLIKQTVREELAAGVSNTPELITIEETCEFLGVGRLVVDELFAEHETNGFPAIKLGSRTHKVDKTRLVAWLNNGGLNTEQRDDTETVPFGIVRKTA